MTAYVLTTNGHGPRVRPTRTHANGDVYATVRTASGAWVSGRVIRTWDTERDAMRDRYTPEQRFWAYRDKEAAR